MKYFKISLLFLGLLAAYAPAPAANSTGNLNVSVTIVPQCSVSADNMSFGSAVFLPLTKTQFAKSNIYATCSPGTDYTIASVMGSNGEGCGVPRSMKHSSEAGSSLLYYLFIDSSYTQLWGTGDPINCPGVFSGKGSGVAQTFEVYGQMPGDQTPIPGTYTDTVIVTINFN